MSDEQIEEWARIIFDYMGESPLPFDEADWLTLRPYIIAGISKAASERVKA